MLEEAVRREMLDDAKLERTLSRGRGRRGLKPLRAAIAEMRGPAQWTQSELERQFLALVRTAGLPEPSANVVVEGFLVDLWWPEARLAVEIDGYGFHKTGENGRQTLSAGAGSCGVGGRSLADECPQRAALPPPRGLVPATCSS